MMKKKRRAMPASAGPITPHVPTKRKKKIRRRPQSGMTVRG